MSITTLNNFKFNCGNIFELRFDDLPETSSKANKFQWYLILSGTRYELKFLEMTGTMRKLYYENNIVYLNLDDKMLRIYSKNEFEQYEIEESEID